MSGATPEPDAVPRPPASVGAEEAAVAVSVVIAARDEAPTIAQVVTQVAEVLADYPGGFEILVVSDASRDDTVALARAAGAAVLEQPEPRGYGAALKRGFRRARGAYVVIIDADGTYPAAAIPPMLERLERGAEQVVGARTAAGAQVPLLRRPAKWFIRVLASWLVGQRILDLNSGLRALRRDALEGVLRLLPDGFSCTTTLTVAGLLEDWEVVWLPITYYRRVGSSKFRPVRDTARLLLSLVRAVVYFHPLRVFVPVTLTLAAAGLAFGVYDVVAVRNLTDKTVLTCLAALEMFVLGLLADLVTRRRSG